MTTGEQSEHRRVPEEARSSIPHRAQVNVPIMVPMDYGTVIAAASLCPLKLVMNSAYRTPGREVKRNRGGICSDGSVGASEMHN